MSEGGERVRIEQDAAFRDERGRFHLRFTCEHCAYWDPERDACAHGYPTVEHRAARYDDEAAEVVFCKEFDCG